MSQDPARVAEFVLRPFGTTAGELVPMVGSRTLVDLVRDREYSGFGPFCFPESDYRRAVADLVALLDPTS